MALPNLAARILTTPLLIAPDKLDAILGVVGPRMGLDVVPQTAGPATEPKERAKPKVEARARVTEAGSSDPEPEAIRIGVIQAVGTLANRVDWLDAMSGMTSYETLGDEIERFAADPSIDGILLEIDSFGGEAAGCFDCADRIARARESKPVFGVANQYAMSAGYALLSQCDKVFVPQGGEVGSIGVVTTHVDLTKAAEEAGVRVTHIHAGAHKVDMSSFKQLGDDVRERLQTDIDHVYETFAQAVGRGGRVDADGAKATEALTYVGEKAVSAGLADQVGTKAEALDALAAHVQEQRDMKELEQKLAAAQAENAKLVAENTALKQAAEDRQAKEDEDYLEHLATVSAQAQTPIPAARIEQIKEHMLAGRRDVARLLGDSLLEMAGAAGQKPFTTAPAAPPTEQEGHAKAVASGTVSLLKADGCTDIKVAEDGASITYVDRNGQKREQTLAKG